MISRESFARALEDVRKAEIFSDKINAVLNEYDGGNVYYIGCSDTVQRLLDEEFAISEEESDWVRYWCWELNFGTIGGGEIMVGGKKVDLSTAEKLYDFLVNRKQHK